MYTIVMITITGDVVGYDEARPCHGKGMPYMHAEYVHYMHTVNTIHLVLKLQIYSFLIKSPLKIGGQCTQRCIIPMTNVS